MHRPWLTAGFVAAALGVVALTFGPSPADLLFTLTQSVPGLDELSSTTVEMAANVLLFVPVALLLAAAAPRLSGVLVWLLCTAASAGVEAAQLVLPGRQTSVRDVVLNSAGAAIGVLLHALVGRRRSRSPGRARR
ncbi:VanZ like family protein [Blastococcus aurantiacus]|uniref:VanZ like family protein n=1 Tax=Blastococcus aurantiacus TaxID=1550231 RepID=A0A1G7MRW6_9ACTN|nr:VanZ family protein [Blastococcus aurantiacus]SDF64502.1 VanZ like family protein [Blastococcus aurantiacus]